MRAYGTWIQVEEIIEDKSSAGLYIVQRDADRKILKGKVVSVGSDVVEEAIQPGAVVVADRYAGAAFGDLIFVREDEVKAVLTDA